MFLFGAIGFLNELMAFFFDNHSVALFLVVVRYSMVLLGYYYQRNKWDLEVAVSFFSFRTHKDTHLNIVTASSRMTIRVLSDSSDHDLWSNPSFGRHKFVIGLFLNDTERFYDSLVSIKSR